MRLFFAYSLLGLMLLFNSSPSCAQESTKRARWKALQESAQKIGLCLYMLSLPDDQCKCMMNDGDKSYMSVLDRGWARTRMMGWMKHREQPITNALMIYDRGTNTERGELDKAYIVGSVAEMSPLETRKGSGNQYVFYFKSTAGRTMLNNTYWREFMSSREGRTLDSCMWTFNSMDNEAVKNFVTLFNEWLSLYAKE